MLGSVKVNIPTPFIAATGALRSVEDAAGFGLRAAKKKLICLFLFVLGPVEGLRYVAEGERLVPTPKPHPPGGVVGLPLFILA